MQIRGSIVAFRPRKRAKQTQKSFLLFVLCVCVIFRNQLRVLPGRAQTYGCGVEVLIFRLLKCNSLDFPRKGFGNSRSSLGARSGEYGGCSALAIALLQQQQVRLI